MRDAVFLVFISGLVVLGLRHAFAAYLMWGWAGLIALNTFMYGFLQAVPFVQIFALITLVLLLVGKDTEMLRFTVQPLQVLMVLFGAHALAAAIFAFPGLPRNWELCTNLLKTLLYCLLMPMFVTTRLRAHVMLIVVILGLGFHGTLEGLRFIATAGTHISQGNVKMGDNNHFANLLAMLVPLIFYLAVWSRNRQVRAAFLVMMLLNVLALISTHSRAGLVALAMTAIWLVIRSRQKLLMLTLTVVGVMALITFAPESWFNRMDTIQDAGQDSSFLGRVIAWKRASAIALDYPIFGGGFHSVQSTPVMERYLFNDGLLGFFPTPTPTYAAAAHSIYFEVLGDMGFVGLALFVPIMLSVFFDAAKLKWYARKFGPQVHWASDMTAMISVAMVAYLVGGASISAAYTELPYVIVTLSFVVRQIIVRDLSKALPGASNTANSEAH